MKRVSWRDAPEPCYVIGPYREPLGSVVPGEKFQVETADAFGNRIGPGDTSITSKARFPYVNDLTGPIYVEGAEKGDTLSVTVHDIQPARDYGVSAVIPYWGGLCGTAFTRTLNEPLPERVTIHPIRDDGVVFDPDLDIPLLPLRPFFGTIGTSPEMEAVSSLSAGPHGGDMDASDVCAGSTVHLPVNVPGAHLYAGDVHAAQGDGEITGVAVEIPALATVSVDLIKSSAAGGPRIENSDHIMTAGSARPLEDAARIAFYELVIWLEQDYGFERFAAYQLCSHIAEARLANFVDLMYTVVAKFPRKYLPKGRDNRS